jgi:branched-chain amino acid transport system substrate-binding protein
MTEQRGVSKGKAFFGIVVLVILVIGGVLGYRAIRGERPNGANGSEPYQIGAILPLSGSLGFMGKMEGDGMKLAVEDINAAGGIKGTPLDLNLDDSQGKADIAVTAAQKMMTIDGIKIIVSSFSSVTLGLKPVVERNGGILIGACMHPDFFKDAPNIFRFYIGVEDESRGFVSYLTSLKTAGRSPRIGCLYVEAPNVVEQLEKYVEPGLAKAGLSFVVKESYRLSDKEFRDKILKLRSANLTHLLVIGYGFLYPNIFREMKDQKLLGQVEIVGGWGFLYPNLVPEDLEGVVVVGPSYVFSEAEAVKDFYTRFRQRFGYEANFDAAMTYAAIQLLAHGITTAKSTNMDEVSKSLRHSAQVRTLLGDMSVDSEGAVSFPVGVGRFRAGNIEIIK